MFTDFPSTLLSISGHEISHLEMSFQSLSEIVKGSSNFPACTDNKGFHLFSKVQANTVISVEQSWIKSAVTCHVCLVECVYSKCNLI